VIIYIKATNVVEVGDEFMLVNGMQAPLPIPLVGEKVVVNDEMRLVDGVIFHYHPSAKFDIASKAILGEEIFPTVCTITLETCAL
jgi:hypothetical protein